jgi:hypothetical protein
MNPKIRLITFNARLILKAIASLSLVLHCLSFPAMGQTAPSTKSGEIYAGIELTSEGAKAIALRVYINEEEIGLKLVYSETIPLALGRAGNGQFAPQAIQKAVQAVLKLMSRLRQQLQTSPERIFLIGSSGLGADHPKGLVNAIHKTTGKTIVFLDVETEVQLSIVGTISRLGKVGETQIDNRNSSALIEINSDSIKGGYQLLLREKAELELQAVKNAITPRQLIAGAEALKAVATEFEWQGKQIWFARFGYLGCLLSYVRLQAEK